MTEEYTCRLCDEKIDDYDGYFTPYHDGLLINRMIGVSTTFLSVVTGWRYGGSLKHLKTVVVKGLKPMYVHAKCVNWLVIHEIDNMDTNKLKESS